MGPAQLQLAPQGRAVTGAALRLHSYGSYTYADPAHVHAVTGLSNRDTFTYRCIGTVKCENFEGRVQPIDKLNQPLTWQVLPG